MFVDVVLLNVFLDLNLYDELDKFCWSFELFMVDFLVFLMHKRMHVIQKIVLF